MWKRSRPPSANWLGSGLTWNVSGAAAHCRCRHPCSAPTRLRKWRRIRPHEHEHRQASCRADQSSPFLRPWHSPCAAGRPGGQIDRGRGRGRFGPLHANRAAGGLAGDQRPRHGAGRPQTFHARQFRTRQGAGRKYFEPDDVESVLRDGFRRPVGKHHFAGAQGRAHRAVRPLHLHAHGARHGARHGRRRG